jgi:hypothetical protein
MRSAWAQRLLSPQKLTPWGQTVAYVRDTASVLVAICSPTG